MQCTAALTIMEVILKPRVSAKQLVLAGTETTKATSTS